MNQMRHYIITWSTEVWAENPVEAARFARCLQLNPKSTELLFDVLETNSKGALVGRGCTVDLAVEE